MARFVRWAVGGSIAFLASARAEVRPLVDVLDVAVLNELEAKGFSFGEVIGESKPLTKTSELYANGALYRSFADTIGKPLEHDPKTDQLPDVIPDGSGDVPDMVRRLRGFEDKGARSDKDLKGGFLIRRLANDSAYPYAVERDGDEPRHFDPRWLSSPFGAMKLVGIVNRMDRADVTKDSCGEVRFMYRLSYRAPSSASTLPFVANVVRRYPLRPSCAEFAKKWAIARPDAKALAEGPLKGLEFLQLEVNFQSLRFTSGYMHDFGGQAMYMQRIFRRVGERLEPIGLENTPDVLAVEKNPQLLDLFLERLEKQETLKALDEGTLNLDFDPRFLAKLSVSWSTLGRARTANRPYRRLLEGRRERLAKIDYSKLRYVKSPEALVERLDNLTCMGCHQAGGAAGFHFLGYADPAFSHPFNRQELPLSPHATAERARRAAWLEAVAQGREPNRFRPHSASVVADWSKANGLPDFSAVGVGHLCLAEDGHFAKRSPCGDSSGRAVECRRTVGNASFAPLLGECALKEPVRAAGGVCWTGDVVEGKTRPAGAPSFNFYAFEDKWKLKGPTLADRGGYSCVLPQSGAPLGRMSRPCSVAEENFEVDFSKGRPDEVCANQGGQGFDMCAASGDAGACLEKKIARAMLDSCSPERSCREDYVCQRFPDYHKVAAADYVRKKNGQLVNRTLPDKIVGANLLAARERNVGFCVPTYFLFNMRLDGHPNPLTGRAPGAPKVDSKLPLRGYK